MPGPKARRLAPGDFHLRQPDGQLAAGHQCPDLGKSTARAVAAVPEAIAVAGLAAPLFLKSQNRPDFHIHSNHQISPPLPERRIASSRAHHRRRPHADEDVGDRRCHGFRPQAEDASGENNFAGWGIAWNCAGIFSDGMNVSSDIFWCCPPTRTSAPSDQDSPCFHRRVRIPPADGYSHSPGKE